MSNYQYTSDLMEDVLFRGGEPTDSTSDFNSAVLRYLNRAYTAIVKGGDELAPEINEVWWWLKKSNKGILTLQKRITGDISLTENSINGTLSVDPGIDIAGWHFKVNGEPDVYKIATYDGTVTITLDSVYTGVTNTAACFAVHELEHDLASDVLYISGPMIAYRNDQAEIDGIDEVALDRDFPLKDFLYGMPEKFCMMGEQSIRFSHGGFNDYLARIEYPYLQRPSELTDATNEEPLVPPHYRKLIADAALFFLFTDKDDTRADGIGIQVTNQLRAMREDHQRRKGKQSSNMGAIITRPNQSNRKILRTESGLIIG